MAALGLGIYGAGALVLSLFRGRPTGPPDREPEGAKRPIGFPGAELAYESARQWRRLRIIGLACVAAAAVLFLIAR